MLLQIESMNESALFTAEVLAVRGDKDAGCVFRSALSGGKL